MANIRKVSITEKELKNLKNVGQGAFATVLADEDNEVAIKRYHEYVKSDCWHLDKNPCLRIKKRKFKRLNSRNKHIKYTDTSVELVYEGFKFIGIRKRYYKGTCLDKIGNKKLVIKKDILSKLIRNAKELSDNRIYNLDYKGNNALVTDDGEVKILDLDDIWTKVTLLPNYIYKTISLKKLQQMVIDIIYDNQLQFPESVARKLTCSPENNPNLQKRFSYKQLQEFVNSVKFEGNVIIINSDDIKNINLDNLKEYLQISELYLVLAFRKNKLFSMEDLNSVFDSLDQHGIAVYDIFKYNDDIDDYNDAVNNYIISHECTNTYIYDNDFKVLKKRS